MCGDDVSRCDWLLEGIILLVRRRKDDIGGVCAGFGGARARKRAAVIDGRRV